MEEFIMKGNIELSNNVSLYVEEHGEGPSLILIPGWAYTMEVFRQNIPVLSKHYHTIAYDPRSHGRSPATATGNDYLQHGEDLCQLIAALNLSEVTLIGWSLGVYDILAYLERFGFDKVKGLVLIDESPTIIQSAPGDWGEGDKDEIEGLIGAVAADFLPFFREYTMSGFVGEAPAELVDRFTEYAATLSTEQAAGLLSDATSHDFRPIAQKAAQQVPVLQILREDWSGAAEKWIMANQPNAEVFVQGGHLMLLEFAEAVNQRLLSFLGKIHQV